jgi:hypothetical protein
MPSNLNIRLDLLSALADTSYGFLNRSNESLESDKAATQKPLQRGLIKE